MATLHLLHEDTEAARFDAHKLRHIDSTRSRSEHHIRAVDFAKLFVSISDLALTQKKAPTTCNLGSSCYPSEQGMFQMVVSSRSAPCDAQPAESLISESAIDSATDDDYVESAIDDDDSSDWEDFVQDSGKSRVDAKFFQRVESKANLVSHRSLISLMLAQTERVPKEYQQQSSHSACAVVRSRAGPSGRTALGVSPNDSDEGPLMLKGTRPSVLQPLIEAPRSSARSIVTPTNVHAQAVLLPRTRCNVLATELPQFPEKPFLKKSEDANASSLNQHFITDAFDGYHSKGW
ncbi:dsp1-1-like protein [Beauveria bassiana ARSEF 2860]|uniref:Dsp1-1-like protein n=1 Tax=Beauveria bassiana (strain ARSEF 2860) TaxID=655819 RepID=J5J2M9_BEAB2|nr:dsp1-1-like protein [Beauveria bassiana ARSEF 2860]EJP61088.1 dsp1-1-like protein [Beauveria bassiana ARSEF 2860]